MPQPQAVGFAEAFSDVMTTELATKSDLKELRGLANVELADIRTEMRTGFADVRTEMRTGFAKVETEFARVRTEIESVRGEVARSRTENVRWLVGLFIAQTSVTVGLLLRLAP